MPMVFYIGILKEIAETEMCKFELWDLYQKQISQILQIPAFQMEQEYKNILYKEN